ncbi:S10 family peptidase [Rhizosphaericola mali]|uniref:Carboxypeptidase n=1 Tax=Rhizosphaericola mali TaxID=2545455 RepID=A0A5P2G5Y1_9BACT|nr:carboxypeptidase [Rhizosphaericola mali]QES89130.1 carboxypeptidase [Rhizosphaericola mali]
MIKILAVFTSAFLTIFSNCLMAQRRGNSIPIPEYKNPTTVSPSMKIDPDTCVITKHSAIIRGVNISYTTRTGTMPIWNEDGSAIADIFYTYYERDNINDRAKRPLLISFNGGPGTASLWMQIGYTGPRMLNIDDEGYPILPYGMRDNPYSLLDDADIVYIDPVNTGYARKTSKDVPDALFYGVNQDVKYIADWINTFVSRINRWKSPKFLIGESYGTTRAAGLAEALQSREWMFLNGVILVSPTELGIKRDGPVSAALKTPYFAATAWYHKKLLAPYADKKLKDFLPEVEKFTIEEFIPALAYGGILPAEKKAAIAKKLESYTGIKASVYLNNNLDVSPWLFWKELLREEGFTIGRLDSRYKGIDAKDGGVEPDYNMELVAWNNAFAPAMNDYVRNELGFKTDLKYNVFGSVFPWDNNNNNTGYDLGNAMRQNPALNLFVQSGYFDGACDYFNAKYNTWQLDPNGKLQNRIKWEGYESGHMMYLRMQDRKVATQHIRDFMKSSIKYGIPIKY